MGYGGNKQKIFVDYDLIEVQAKWLFGEDPVPKLEINNLKKSFLKAKYKINNNFDIVIPNKVHHFDEKE